MLAWLWATNDKGILVYAILALCIVGGQPLWWTLSKPYLHSHSWTVTNPTSQRPQNRILRHLAIPQDLGCTDATVVPEVRTFIIHQDHVLQPSKKKTLKLEDLPDSNDSRLQHDQFWGSLSLDIAEPLTVLHLRSAFMSNPKKKHPRHVGEAVCHQTTLPDASS